MANDRSAALMAGADLQDDLLIALNDLLRLQTLLDDSHHALQSGFFGMVERLAPAQHDGAVQAHVKSALKALQFQDMATQLIAHTSKRLRGGADRLARAALAGDDDEGDTLIEPAPMRPNPVTQSAMDTGFVELF